MNTPREQERMDQQSNLVTINTLRPVVCMFLDRITSGTWETVQTGRLDEETKTILTDMFVDILEIVAKSLLELLRNRLTEEERGAQKSPEVSEEEVYKRLGNLGEIVTQTVAEVQGVGNIRYSRTQEMTELLVAGVTERVNSKLSQSCYGEDVEEHKTSPGMAKKMALHFKKILRKCATKMSKMLSRKKAEQEQEEEEEEHEGEVRSVQREEEEEVMSVTQTPGTSLQQDKPSCVESKANAFTKSVISVKTILEEHLRQIDGAADGDGLITEEDMEQLNLKSSQDSKVVAIQIVDILTNSSQQDVVSTPNEQDKSKTVTPTRKSLRKRIASKIKALFIRKYARESILSVMTKLSDKETSSQREIEEELSVEILLNSVHELVDDMMSKVVLETGSSSEEDCLFEKLASYISSGKHGSDAEVLSEALADHLIPEEDIEVQSQVEIRTEVKGFMKRMKNWLIQQVQKCKGKKGNISIAVKQISKVVSIQPEETSALEEETETLTYIKPKNKSSQSSTSQCKEEEVPAVTQTPVTSLQEDDKSSVESKANAFIKSVISVKTILEEHLRQIDGAADGDGLITEEDMEQLNLKSSQDSKVVAIQIVDILTNSSQQDVVSTLNEQDKSKTVTPTRKSLRKRIASKIKALFIRKYARESILSVMTKLSDKETSSQREIEEELSVEILLNSVHELVDDMISNVVLETGSSSEEHCLFEKLASYISSGKHDSDAEVLSEALADHLMPEEDNEEMSQVEIRTEVEGFMKRMKNWLIQQVQKCKGKKGNISMAVQEISKVVSIQPEETSALEEETETLTYIKPKNKSSQSSTSQCKEEEVPAVTQTPVTSLQEDDKSSVESKANAFIKSVISVKTILEEHLRQIDGAADGDGLITEEDMEQLNLKSSQDSKVVAIQIVDILTNSSQQDVVSTLNKQDHLKTVTPTRKSLRKRIASKIKALFIRKYARESILSVTTKLSDKETSSERETEEGSYSETLLDSVDELMNDMMSKVVLETRSSTKEDCLFEKFVSYISSGKHDSDAELLSEALADHLMPEEDNEEMSQVEIRTEVEGFMKRMRDWLIQQVQKCKGKKGNISMAVQEISKVVSIQPEETSALEEETETLTYIKPKNKSSKSSTSQCKEEEVPAVTQTPVTSLQEDKPSSVESKANAFIKSVISVKTILEEHLRQIDGAADGDSLITEEDMEQLHSRSDQDLEELAIEIVEILTYSSQQDVVSTQNEQDKSKTVTPTRKTLKKRIASKIKALLIRKYARESILSVTTKLSDKETSSERETEEGSYSETLLDSVDELMNDMMSKVVLETRSSTKEDCLFEKFVSYISSGKHDSDAELLREALADHLMPEEDNEEMSQVEIRTEVEGFMKRMRDWLIQQVQKCKGKKGNISMAVQEISKVVSIQPEETSALEEETETLTYIKPKSDKRVKRVTFAPEWAVPQRSTPDHAVPQPSTSQCAVPQRSTPERVVPQPSTSQCAVPQRSTPGRVVPQPSILDLTVPQKSTPERVVPQPSTSQCAVPQQSTPERVVPQPSILDLTGPQRSTPHTPKLQNWDQLTCEIIVLELSRTILKDLPIDQTHSAYKATVAKLTNMLWTEVRGSEVGVDLSSVNLKKICKKVAKELSKKVGDALLWRSLLSQTQSLNEVVVETLTKQLFPKKTSGIKRFFTRIFKPITSLFKRN
ncbi:uncharacterized protein LOC117813751 isoform X2 [Notolabrus celidotus]|uniref:uncharacterized protein LOC117813751 isoform X2 n=1 Tax=Notolabrus celidotus TaxID=1203425 RepID=UPI00148FE4BE|nr:uncharacterized protein LOC117813751 isoform X2 [Notolabrus celidotus]